MQTVDNIKEFDFMQIWRIMTLRSNHTRSVSVFLLTLFLLPSCHHLSTQYVVPPLPSLSISELLSWTSFLSGAVPDGGTDPWGQQNIWLQGIKLADFCLFCLFNHFPVLYRSTLSSHFSALKQDLHIFKYLFNITYVSHKCLYSEIHWSVCFTFRVSVGSSHGFTCIDTSV